MCKFRTHYDNLNVMQNATPAVIKSAYKTLCQIYHPDKYVGGYEQAHLIMKLINKAYAILSDPIKRIEHDKWIAEKENPFTWILGIATVVKNNTKEQHGDEEINQNKYRNNFSSNNNSVHTNNADGFYLSRIQLENNYHSWIA
jgi:DnaJ-class molecular chaperone